MRLRVSARTLRACHRPLRITNREWRRLHNSAVAGQKTEQGEVCGLLCADGTRIVTYLVSSSQTLSASYRYDPFGNLISSSGSLAAANVYRFSSKENHANSGMHYYLYRFYDPNLQRWVNPDPLGDVAEARL